VWEVGGGGGGVVVVNNQVKDNDFVVVRAWMRLQNA
jgi:hypothetical protein